MKLKYHFVIRRVADAELAIAVGSSVYFNGMIKLNESAKCIFERLSEGDATTEELVDALKEAYDIDAKTAREAVEGFLEELRKNELLEE